MFLSRIELFVMYDEQLCFTSSKITRHVLQVTFIDPHIISVVLRDEPYPKLIVRATHR